MVEYKESDNDPQKLAIPWYSWLSYRRDNPPTKDELLKLNQKQQILREKIKQLDEEDYKLRIQERISKEEGIRVDDDVEVVSFETIFKKIQASEENQNNQKK